MERFNKKSGSIGSQQLMDSKNEKESGINFNLPKDLSVGIIKVVGVGGGGCNAVRNMYLEEQMYAKYGCFES